MGLLQALAPLLEHPDAAGVYTDFDGTLAPIVDDPALARPLEGAAEVLTALALRYARVGVISGRPVRFLQQMLAPTGVDLWGEYGLERASGREIQAVDGAAAWRGVVEESAARAEAAGVAQRVERKSLSVTLHFRADPTKEKDLRSWAREEAARTGLELQPARMAVELRPPLHRDKGTALSDAAAGLAASCFLGDDRGDLAAFDALDRLADEGQQTVRIAVRSPEMPPELEQRADVVVDGPLGALDLLRGLAG